MAGSSRASDSTSSIPLLKQSRVADAVKVAPYLTHVVRHHGQVTLIPPENLGRIRKERKRRPPLNRFAHSSDSSSRERRTLPSRPSSSRSSAGLRSSVSAYAHSNASAPANFSIPDVPPPSFEDAIAQIHDSSVATSSGTSSLPTGPQSAPASTRPPVTPTRSQPARSVEPTESTSPFRLPHSGNGSDSSNTTISCNGKEGRAEWENDRSAGLSLEERVRREFERRQLAEALPSAAHLRSPSAESQSGPSSRALPDDRTHSPDSARTQETQGFSRLRRIMNTPSRSQLTSRVSDSSEHPAQDSLIPPASRPGRARSSGNLRSNATSSQSHSPSTSITVSSSSRHGTHTHCSTTLQLSPSRNEADAHGFGSDLHSTRNQLASPIIPVETSQDWVVLSVTNLGARSRSPSRLEQAGAAQSVTERPLPPIPAPTLSPGQTSVSSEAPSPSPVNDNTYALPILQRSGLWERRSDASQDGLQVIQEQSRHGPSIHSSTDPGPPLVPGSLPEAPGQQGTDEPEPRFLQRSASEGFTELDLLLARLEDPDVTVDGRSYDDLLLLEEIMGPAEQDTRRASAFDEVLVGHVEVLRRRVTKEGKTKLKLTLLGTVVDRCGICLSQYKEGALAGLLPCTHAFHSKCLRNWLRSSTTCPICRRQILPSI